MKGDDLRRLKLNHGTVVAYLGLFIALGGVSYAAITLPDKSVGTRHLKKNAVVSSKVKNGSLLRNDFRAGQVPRGPAGATGPTGATGPAGSDEPEEVVPIFRRQPPNTAAFETVFERDGLRVEGRCTGNLGQLALQFDHEAGLLSVERLFDDSSLPTLQVVSGAANDNLPIGLGVNDSARLQVSWRRDSDGRSVGLEFTATNKNAAVSLDCAYFGTALVDG